jgi:hypothetical protein
MYGHLHRARWIFVIVVGSFLAPYPATPCAQEKTGGWQKRASDGDSDDRTLRLIMEQASEENFDAVDENAVITTVSKALEKRKRLPDDTVCKLLLARGQAHLRLKDFAAA